MHLKASWREEDTWRERGRGEEIHSSNTAIARAELRTLPENPIWVPETQLSLLFTAPSSSPNPSKGELILAGNRKDTSRMLESGIDLVLKLRHFNAAFEQLKQHLHGYARCPQKGTSELSTNTFGLRAWLSLYSNRMDWFGLLCESLFWKLIFKRPCKYSQPKALTCDKTSQVGWQPCSKSSSTAVTLHFIHMAPIENQLWPEVRLTETPDAIDLAQAYPFSHFQLSAEILHMTSAAVSFVRTPQFPSS